MVQQKPLSLKTCAYQQQNVCVKQTTVWKMPF